jgi:hypothetical protein
MKIIIFGTKDFLRFVLRGKKFRLDCGHLWPSFYLWTNTAVFLADGRVICHSC